MHQFVIKRERCSVIRIVSPLPNATRDRGLSASASTVRSTVRQSASIRLASFER